MPVLNLSICTAITFEGPAHLSVHGASKAKIAGDRQGQESAQFDRSAPSGGMSTGISVVHQKAVVQQHSSCSNVVFAHDSCFGYIVGKEDWIVATSQVAAKEICCNSQQLAVRRHGLPEGAV